MRFGARACAPFFFASDPGCIWRNRGRDGELQNGNKPSTIQAQKWANDSVLIRPVFKIEHLLETDSGTRLKWHWQINRSISFVRFAERNRKKSVSCIAEHRVLSLTGNDRIPRKMPRQPLKARQLKSGRIFRALSPQSDRETGALVVPSPKNRPGKGPGQLGRNVSCRVRCRDIEPSSRQYTVCDARASYSQDARHSTASQFPT